MIFFIASVILFVWVTYTAMELRKATLAIGLLLVAYMLIGDPSTIYTSIPVSYTHLTLPTIYSV